MCYFRLLKRKNSVPDRFAMHEFNADGDPHWLERYNNRSTDDARAYILKHPKDVLVAEQIHCYPRAVLKFPEWHQPGMLYTRLALEQSSGELTARHKAHLLHHLGGTSIADLTGGLGMDTLAFARHFTSVIYADPASQPLQLARHNHHIHGLNAITYLNLSAEEALSHLPEIDWIYLDPSRRSPQERVFRLTDSQPDVLHLLPRLLQKARGILLKLSPMYDLHQLINEIPFITQLQVVSVQGEVKEILAVISAEGAQTANSSPLQPQIRAVCLPGDYYVGARFDAAEHVQILSDIPEPPFFLHIPDAAITKARLTDQWARQHQLARISPVNDYLISTHSEKLPGGRTYRIDSWMPYKPREIVRRMPDARVHIHRRDFHSTPEQLYKKLRFSMGDDAHLFFTSWGAHKQIVLVSGL
jgi:hypothetical protein